MVLKYNHSARQFILKRMEEKGVEFDIDKQLNDEFFDGLTDLFRLECLGVVIFNHKFFKFVNDIHSIPHKP